MYRASLKKCLEMMAYQFRLSNYDSLAITSHPISKYYSLKTDQELLDWIQDPQSAHGHILCHLTPGELNQLTTTTQTDLFGQEPPHGS